MNKLLKLLFLLSGIIMMVFTGCEQRHERTSQSEEEVEIRPQLRLEIVISERRLYVYHGDELIRTYPVAVGQPEHPTITGDFNIHQIDWNPDWSPPDSDWAEGDDYTPPGHTDNPMGRARIVYQSPYTIHGTEDIESLGQAQSHGSVRMANHDVIELARMIMEETGDEKPEEWYQNVLNDPETMVTVELSEEIPLTNRE